MKIRSTLICTATQFLLAFWSPALSQNLLANGELDLDLAEWVETSGEAELTWESIDHGSCGDLSGSGFLSNFAAGAGFTLGTRSCATGIVPGQAYSLEGFLRFPTGQLATGSANLILNWLDSVSDCNGFSVVPSAWTPSLNSSTTGVWSRRRVDAVAPVGAFSAWVWVSLAKVEAGDTLDVRFDGVHLVEGAGFLFADGFAIASTCRWSSQVP